jgi:hypothetical protein
MLKQLAFLVNESFNCGVGGPTGERSFFRPRFAAPEGKYGWLTRGTFVATLELDGPPARIKISDQVEKAELPLRRWRATVSATAPAGCLPLIASDHYHARACSDSNHSNRRRP